MRLLIITQKIDRKDPVLGFVHRWVAEFSKQFKSIVVVCLEKGDYDLPGNVAVLSLGKEKWKSKLKYVFLLFYFSVRYFNRYDAVLVHMNQEYILSAGWLWKLLGKKVYMWRNHFAGSALTDISSVFCTKIFCTSRYSYTARYKKTKFMPVGVDTTFFKPDPSVSRLPFSILSLGRISASKNIHTLIKAAEIMKKDGVRFTADIYGNVPPGSEEYAAGLALQIKEAGMADWVKLMGGIPNDRTPGVYSAHHAFVNLSQNGMYDKTIFEAMACGCMVFASNDDLRGKLDDSFMFDYDDPVDLAKKLSGYFDLPEGERNKRSAAVTRLVEDHSLAKLSDALAREIGNK